MSLNNWVRYSCPSCDVVVKTFRHKETQRNVLDVQGYKGQFYMLPQKEHNIRGHTSGCFRILFTKTPDFPPTSEIRIYCMVSEENLVDNRGSCYVAALNGNRQVSLYKYTKGINTDPEVLCSLRLPAEYRQGVFGLMWAYNPAVREGLFLRGLLSVDPKNSQNAYRLFDYVDTNDPLVISDGEGFGVSIPEQQSTQVYFERTSLHLLRYIDPSEDEIQENGG